MKLSDLFIKEAMDLSLKTTTKSETLAHLAGNFASLGKVSDVDAYVAALEAREAQSTTGVGDEIAIPHGNTNPLQKLRLFSDVANKESSGNPSTDSLQNSSS